MSRITAIYVRVSTDKQTNASQMADLTARAAACESLGKKVVWYEDSFTGKTMGRPGWRKLENDINSGKIGELVVWRIDRLGRTTSGTTAVFDSLRERGVNFISVREGVDLSTPAGRMMADVIAAFASYETEVRAERVKAGLAARRAKGLPIGGSSPGRIRRKTAERVATVLRLHDAHEPISTISRLLGLHRVTIRGIIRRRKSYTKLTEPEAVAQPGA